jgi:hypothetical protein
MLQRDGVVMMMMKVLVAMVMMMIPMKPVSMTMVTISPLREGMSPGRFLPAGELSLSVCFPPSRGGGVFL